MSLTLYPLPGVDILFEESAGGDELVVAVANVGDSAETGLEVVVEGVGDAALGGGGRAFQDFVEDAQEDSVLLGEGLLVLVLLGVAELILV